MKTISSPLADPIAASPSSDVSAASSRKFHASPAKAFMRHPAWLALSLLTATALAPAAAQIPVQMQAEQALQADPPGQVARLGYADGAVSFSPAEAGGNGDWSAALLNRPLTTGDRLWTAQRARSELHIGSTAVRMDGETSLDFLTLDDDTTQLRLAQGTLNVRVRALYEGQRFEINTPNLAVVLRQAGEYRIDVIPSSNVTRVVVLSGSVQVYGDNGVPFVLGNQQQSSFTGTRLAQVMLPGAERADTFDAWATDRNRIEDQSVSARYIPRDVPGYQQLDNYGDWSQDASYGPVWIPRAVPVNWAPYRAGHWDWIAPWGWTWIDDAPWGFAPFHYGRWTQIGPRWAWAPGRIAPRPVYAPALVGFIGGGGSGLNWNIAIGGRPGPGVGWFPLGPGEAFRPHYRGSPRYIGRLNNNIVINNNVNVYRFQRMPGAVTAIGSDDFRRGRPVRGGVALSAADLNRAQFANGVRDIPQRPGRGNADDRPRAAPGATPPPAVIGRPVVDGRRDDARDGRPGDRGGRGDDLRNGRPDGNRPDAGRGRNDTQDGNRDGNRGNPRPALQGERGPSLVLPPDRGVPQPDRAQMPPDRGIAGNGTINPGIAAQMERARQEREQARLRATQPGNPLVNGQESLGARAEREQAEKNSQRPPRSDPRPNTDRDEFIQLQRQQQQLQREQWQLQRDAQRQQQQQNRQDQESIGQRAMRETAQRDREAQRQLQQARPPQPQPQQPRPGAQTPDDREPRQPGRNGRPLQGLPSPGER
ncbi:MAG: chromosome partitioning protein ParA [Polaromonas sp.]|nr:chromosome partitioning protein ParA [Polaromonas sp.]